MKISWLLADLVLVLICVVSFFGAFFFASQGKGVMTIICLVVWYLSFLLIAKDD